MWWTFYLTKNREKPYRWLQAPYQKCTAMFLWTSLPSFSKSTQREHSIITVEKGISIDQPKTLLPLSNHCFSQTSELDKRRCILSEVVPESAFKYYCDLLNRRSYQNSGFDVFVPWQSLTIDCMRGSWLRDCGRECDQPLTWTFLRSPMQKIAAINSHWVR